MATSKNKLTTQSFWLLSSSGHGHPSVSTCTPFFCRGRTAYSCRFQADPMAEADFCVRGLARVLQKAINPSVREHFLRCESLAPVFPWSFSFCRGSVHHTASLPLAGIHEPPFLLNFLCLSFLFSTVAGELHTAPTPGKPWLPILVYLEANQNPVLTGNCPGTLNRQQLPKAIFLSSSEETINFSHDSLNCNSKWHRFCYLFPWKTCLKWMMNECIADGCISLLSKLYFEGVMWGQCGVTAYRDHVCSQAVPQKRLGGHQWQWTVDAPCVWHQSKVYEPRQAWVQRRPILISLLRWGLNDTNLPAEGCLGNPSLKRKWT